MSQKLHLVVPGFCGPGDHTPLHSVLLEAARRGHHVTVGFEGTEKDGNCGHVFAVPDEMRKRFRYVTLIRTDDHKSAFLEALSETNPLYDMLSDMSGGAMNDMAFTNKVLEKTVMPLFRPIVRFLFDTVVELRRNNTLSSSPLTPVIVSHQFFPVSYDVSKHLNVPYVMLWFSSIELFDIPGRLCGGMSTVELQSSLQKRILWLRCLASFVTSMANVDPVRKQILAENNISLDIFEPQLKFTETVRLISSSIVGFDRPHPVSPLLTHVGPLIYGTSSTMDVASAGELHARLVRPFLDGVVGGGATPRVVVLAFGSTAMPQEAMQEAFVRGIVPLMRERANLRLLIAGSWRTKEFRSLVSKILCPNEATSANVTLSDATQCDERVLVVKWIAQRAVLNHANVAVFGSHCGFGSLSEALYYGRAVLAYSFAFDQHDNAQRAVEWGAALRLDVKHPDAGLVTLQLRRLLDEKSFTDAAQRYSIAAKFAGGVGRAVDIIENEAAIGHSHLLLAPRYVSFVDAIVVVCVGLLFVLYLLYRLLRCVCCRNTSQSSSKSKPE